MGEKLIDTTPKPFDGTYPITERDPKIMLRGSKPAQGTKEYAIWEAENTKWMKENWGISHIGNTE
jgi:hypothetical protein